MNLPVDALPMLNRWTGRIQHETGKPVELEQVTQAFAEVLHDRIRAAPARGPRKLSLDHDDTYLLTKAAVLGLRRRNEDAIRDGHQTMVLLVECCSWIRREVDVPVEHLVGAFFGEVGELRRNLGSEGAIRPIDLFERIKARVKAVGRLAAEDPRPPVLRELVDSSVDPELAVHSVLLVMAGVDRDIKEGKRRDEPSDDEMRRLVEAALVRNKSLACVVRVVSRVREETGVPTEQVAAAYRNVRDDLLSEACSGGAAPGPMPDMAPLVKKRTLELASMEGGKNP